VRATAGAFAGLLALLVAVGSVASDPGAERVLLQRLETLGESAGPGGYRWYSPTEPVAGAHEGFFAVAPEAQRTVSAAALAEARAYAAANRSESLLVWHRGALQSADYWMGHDPDSVVNSRSMHKMLGGLLIARAVAEGHIGSIDDPVADYIPAWRDTDKAAMTIRNVLQMSSGMRWFSIRDKGPSGLSTRRYLDPYWDEVLLQEIPMSFEPGTEYDYSDITADIMPHVIQGATGERYSAYLSRALLQPLGAPGGFIWVNREGGMPHGGCCLMLPPEAWLRLGILVLNDGVWNGTRLLPDYWLEEMLTPSAQKEHFGLMIWLGSPYIERRLYHRPESPINQVPNPGVYQSEPFLADDLFMFDGSEGRLVYIVPSRQLVIVRTGFRPAEGQPEWDNAAIANAILT